MTDHKKDQLCARIEELEAEKMELNEQVDIAQGGPVAWATRLYNTAYHAGHHDTVEGGYTHVYPQDMDSHHEDVVQEWLADNPQPAPDVTMLLGLLDDCLNSMRNAYPDYDHYESKAYISAMAVFENRAIGRRHGKSGAAAPESPAVQGGPVGWQFYQDGKWWNGDDRIKDHRKNTEEAGLLVRDVYAAPQTAPGVAGLVEALVAILEHDSPINIVDTATATERDIFDIARATLAAHSKQGVSND